MNQVQINYDDDLLDAVDKINEVLKQRGLVLVDDGLPHEGYCIFTLQDVAKVGASSSAPG